MPDIPCEERLRLERAVIVAIQGLYAAESTARGSARIAEDVESADMSGVSGTPSFFINVHRHQGAYDIDTLTQAVKLAKARAFVSS